MSDIDLDKPLDIEYRLTWEMADPHQANALESRYGKGVWQRMSDEDWAKLDWKKSGRNSTDLIDLADQRATLDLWASTHQEPIRNVRLFRRAVHVTEWEEIVSEEVPE